MITTEEELFTSKMFENARSGVQHSIPLSTNFKILKHFNLAASANYKEVWQPRTVRYNNYDPLIDGVKKDTISGFSAFRTYSYGLNMATTIYGTVNFEKERYGQLDIPFAPQFLTALHLVLINIMMNTLLTQMEILENIPLLKVVFLEPHQEVYLKVWESL